MKNTSVLVVVVLLLGTAWGWPSPIGKSTWPEVKLLCQDRNVPCFVRIELHGTGRVICERSNEQATPDIPAQTFASSGVPNDQMLLLYPYNDGFTSGWSRYAAAGRTAYYIYGELYEDWGTEVKLRVSNGGDGNYYLYFSVCSSGRFVSYFKGTALFNGYDRNYTLMNVNQSYSASGLCNPGGFGSTFEVGGGTVQIIFNMPKLLNPFPVDVNSWLDAGPERSTPRFNMADFAMFAQEWASFHDEYTEMFFYAFDR
jgi:hypothetical protein